jgi:hypothetical protein
LAKRHFVTDSQNIISVVTLVTVAYFVLCTKMLVAMTLVTMTLGKTMPDITTLIFRLG